MRVSLGRPQPGQAQAGVPGGRQAREQRAGESPLGRSHSYGRTLMKSSFFSDHSRNMKFSNV